MVHVGTDRWRQENGRPMLIVGRWPAVYKKAVVTSCSVRLEIINNISQTNKISKDVVRACVRACVLACVRACVRACLCVNHDNTMYRFHFFTRVQTIRRTATFVVNVIIIISCRVCCRRRRS